MPGPSIGQKPDASRIPGSKPDISKPSSFDSRTSSSFAAPLAALHQTGARPAAKGLSGLSFMPQVAPGVERGEQYLFGRTQGREQQQRNRESMVAPADSIASGLAGLVSDLQSQNGGLQCPVVPAAAVGVLRSQQSTGLRPRVQQSQTQAPVTRLGGQQPAEMDDWTVSEDEGQPEQAAALHRPMSRVRDAEIAQLVEMGFTPKQAVKVRTGPANTRFCCLVISCKPGDNLKPDDV